MAAIAFITDNFRVGRESGYGGSQYLQGLTRRLRELDVTTQIFARGPDQEDVIGVGSPYSRHGQLDKLTFSRALWWQRDRFREFELIQSQSASTIPFLGLMRRTGKPTIFDCRTSLARTTRLLSAFQLSSLTFFRPSEILVCDQVSAADSERLLRRRATYIRVPVDVPEQTPGPVRGVARSLLFASQLAHDKGFLDVVNAMTALWTQGSTLQLHIAGEGPLRSVAERVADESQGRAVYHGLLSPARTREIVSQSDLLINPSLTEGVSRSVLEAMSAGVPVIASNVGGMRELAERDLFQVVKRDRPVVLADTIRRLSTDSSRRQDLSRRAWSYVHDHHRWDTTFDRLLGVYANLGVPMRRIGPAQ